MVDKTFGSILDRPSTDIERPKPLPVGTYTCIVDGPPRMDKSSKKGTEFVEFNLKPLAAGDDVDEGALKEVGGLTKKMLRATYYLTEDAIWRLKEFLNDLGIEEEDMSLRQRIAEAPGNQIIVEVRHEASQDGETVFARIGKTAAVE